MEIAVNKYDDSQYPLSLFVAYTFGGKDSPFALDPGYEYRVRVRGLNREGAGPWSNPSYSVSTVPGKPYQPDPPCVAKASLTSIKFEWAAPFDCGSAVTGYRIYIKHLRKTIDLPRTVLTYKIYGCKPGKAYFMKVLAKNSCGFSPFSEFNSHSDCRTLTSAPEHPCQLVPVSGTYCAVRLCATVPYHNGSRIVGFMLQKRTIEAFSRSDWGAARFIALPSSEVKVVTPAAEPFNDEAEEVPLETPETIAEALALYNPFKNKFSNLGGKVTGELALWDEKAEEKDELFEKPEGEVIEFDADGLEAGTIYEFRVAFQNAVGLSEWSIPSRRAKTNRDAAPAEGRPPVFQLISATYVDLLVDVPNQGGAPIDEFIIESRDVARNVIKATVHPYDGENSKYRIIGLTAGSMVQFRARAINRIGEGPSSHWTGEMRLPDDEPVLAPVTTVEKSQAKQHAAVKAASGGANGAPESSERIPQINMPPSSKFK